MLHATRRGLSITILGVAAVASAHGACGGAGGDAGTTTATSTTGMGGAGGKPTTSAGGAGGTAGAGGTMMAGINAASQDVSNPIDATPDPDGKTIYFTAADPVVGTGVFRVPASGGAATLVAVGDPFVSPLGISIDGKGKTLFVADPSAKSGANMVTGEEQDGGRIFTLSVSGGTPTALAGTEGRRPRNLDVLDLMGSENVYFTGFGDNGAAGVLKISTMGGTATTVASGAPFVDPSGIVMAKNGDAYVADSRSAGEIGASIIQVKGSAATEIVTGLAVGYPIGVSINVANTTLYVSGLDPATRTDVVIVIELATKKQTTYTGDTKTDISKFEESAGLHRAKNVDVFAWADRSAPAASAQGTVFTISF